MDGRHAAALIAELDRSLFGEPSLEERAATVEELPGDPRRLEVPRHIRTDYFTHGLFRYVGKLPPPLVAYFLNRYTVAGDLVLDPMCGGGTTAIEAASSGRPSKNFDINPVALIITEALTSPIEVEALESFTQRVLAKAEARDVPEALAGYFNEHAYGVLSAGLDLASNPVETALILSIVRRASNANTKKINTVIDPSKTPESPRKLLTQWSARFSKAFGTFYGTKPEKAEVVHGKAEDLPGVEASSVGFTMLHPPYLTNTAFSEVTDLQLRLLGYDPKRLRGNELAYRGSYFHVPNGLKRYLVGWATILASTYRALRVGGIACVVIGDGQIDRIRIPMGAITEEFGRDIGYRVIDRYVHVLNNQTGLTLSRRMTCQHVVVLEK
jgi:hypothetical protein